MDLVFFLFGLTLTCTVGLFFAAIFTSWMISSYKKGIVMIIIAIAIGFGLVECMNYEHNLDIINWNNGVCLKCGDRLELFDVVHYHNSGNEYYYKCVNGHVVTTHSLFEID